MTKIRTTVPLVATGLSINFGALQVLQSVDLRLEKGARHALIGPNGAGKTTLVNLLSGALRATDGSIFMGNAEISKLPLEQRAERGLVRTFQISQLFSGLTVFENVALAAMRRRGVAMSMLRTCWSFRQVTADVMAIIDELGLRNEVFRPIRELSYGKQRLVELAIALGLRPGVLLLDEPMAGIPVGERGPVLDAVAKLDPDLAILVIEHDIDFVLRFAQEITVLASGRVLARGTPQAIASNGLVAEAYMGTCHG